MKKAFLLLVIIIIAVSCSYSGWSLREQGYIKNIPANYQTHQSGIIKNPSRKDINDAIIFGKLEKDGRAVDYAYITKTSFGNIIVYCRIYTPLRLISEHSRNCAREYIKINDTTIEYLSKMNAVKIDVLPQYTITNTWNIYGYEEDIILLRDGFRVPNLTQLSAMDRNNPFDLIIIPEINEIQKEAMHYAMQYTQLYTSAYTKEQKITYCKQLKKMGYSNNDIVNYTGFPADSVILYIGKLKSEKKDTIYLTEKDNIYSIDELNKQGNYEIVFRTPMSNNLFYSGDKEKRIPISFEKFK
ncbi:MAG: hypothetical protein RAP70_03895 [Candidatus Celaenobacter antarcticus]|nr:hypothetical protein [Candidatus Celaenobacter antarcticus]MDP8314200.1 hypothetical protein [Candidatus Celaenobacter antarcticus]